ncbi:hypothetical protein NL676_027579 [Syzygium grande]|nr:hypothetical protein NL676_027579 [Syzygium grande]
METDAPVGVLTDAEYVPGVPTFFTLLVTATVTLRSGIVIEGEVQVVVCRQVIHETGVHGAIWPDVPRTIGKWSCLGKRCIKHRLYLVVSCSCCVMVKVTLKDTTKKTPNWDRGFSGDSGCRPHEDRTLRCPTLHRKAFDASRNLIYRTNCQCLCSNDVQSWCSYVGPKCTNDD